jgi:hypothetical protein
LAERTAGVEDGAAVDCPEDPNDFEPPVGGALARVQARFSQALSALAKVRRLNRPVVINQVNVGRKVVPDTMPHGYFLVAFSSGPATSCVRAVCLAVCGPVESLEVFTKRIQGVALR